MSIVRVILRVLFAPSEIFRAGLLSYIFSGACYLGGIFVPSAARNDAEEMINARAIGACE